MKAIFIGSKNIKEIDLFDHYKDEDFIMLMNEYSIMESNVVYFSAGDAKIKEIMICKEPTYSV